MKIIFSHPDYLLLLFIIPVLIFIHFLAINLKRSQALKFANFDAIARIKGVDLYSKNITVLIFNIFIVFLIVFSVAGMILKTEGSLSPFSFVIAIDSSQSMEANDIKPSRLEAAKEESLAFINLVPLGTRIGVVSFSGNAQIVQTITSDKNLVNTAIKSIIVQSTGGTDITEAVITSANLLEGEEKKAIILLSDGQLNVGDLEDAINYAKKYSAFVHTIAIGTTIGGETSYGLSKLDEDSLKSIAYNTQGIFSSVEDKEDLMRAFREIADVKLGEVSVNLSDYLLFASLFLVVFVYILNNTRFRVFP